MPQFLPSARLHTTGATSGGLLKHRLGGSTASLFSAASASAASLPGAGSFSAAAPATGGAVVASTESWSALARLLALRLGLIWPLKAITPAIYCYWAYRALRRLRSLRGLQPTGACWRGLVAISAYKFARLWCSLEALFFVFYKVTHRRLQARPARPRVMAPGQPLEALRRTFQVTKDMQAGMKIAGVGCPGSRASRWSPGLSRSLTPKSSHLDIQALLRPTSVDESSVEQLLREWERIHREQADEYALPEAENLSSLEEREAVERLVDSAEMRALLRAEVSGWFLCRRTRERWPASRLRQIGRDNIEEFVAWGFFHCDPAEIPAERRAELQQLVDLGSRELEMDFPPGYNSDVVCMRLTMDRIYAEHRPLAYYAVSAVVLPFVADQVLSWLGFSRHTSGTLAFWYRPGALVGAEGSPSDRPPPFVFCHGIGADVVPYMHFVHGLISSEPRAACFLVSLPHISMRITTQVPSSAELVACLAEMLAIWGHDNAHFVGHSFGSVVLAWVARRAPELMCMATFIDPVCFLLIKPDVCYNFIYRQPRTPLELFIQYFAARELFIAHSLSRNFFWFENILWAEQLGDTPTLVVLSGQDAIVPAHSVLRYLTAFKKQRSVSTLRVLWFPDLGHGDFLFSAYDAVVRELSLLAVMKPSSSLGL